jgi:hypothetical protein
MGNTTTHTQYTTPNTSSGWAFGCQRACGVCSRLLEMADYPLDKRIERVASNYTNSGAHHSRAQ